MVGWVLSWGGCCRYPASRKARPRARERVQASTPTRRASHRSITAEWRLPQTMLAMLGVVEGPSWQLRAHTVVRTLGRTERQISCRTLFTPVGRRHGEPHPGRVAMGGGGSPDARQLPTVPHPAASKRRGMAHSTDSTEYCHTAT